MKRLLLLLLMAWPICAQIVTINGTDTVSNSRATINGNFSYLDTIKGDVYGPASATQYTLPVFANTSGKLLATAPDLILDPGVDGGRHRLLLTRYAGGAGAGTIWGFGVRHSGGSTSVTLGQSAANYTSSPTVSWLPNSTAFINTGLTNILRIGGDMKTGATEYVAFDGGALSFLSGIFRPQSLPGSPATGECVSDSGASNAFKCYNGSAWRTFADLSSAQVLSGKTLDLPILASYLVAGLPAAGSEGRLARVDDSLAIGDCTVGGGSLQTLCLDDGAAWVAFGDGGSGGGSGSLDVEVDGSAVGTETVLNLVTGAGISLTGSNPTGKSQVTVAVDTATIPTKAALQAGTPLYVAPASASATTYTASLSPALTAYTTGMVLHFEPDVGNSGAATLNIDSLGAKAIKLSDGTTDVSASDLDAGKLYHLWYDGTVFRCVSSVEGGSGGGGASDLDDLTDVTITSPATRHGLFNNGSGQFVNRVIEAADLPNTAVTPGSYTAADITVDAQGRITAAANGSGSSYDPLDRTWIYLVDEFLGGQVANGFGVGIGELGWNSTGTTGAATYTEVNSVLGHPGSLRDLRTGATSTNTAYLTLGGGGSNLTTILGTQLHTYSGWSMEFELRTHASDIANIYIGAGFYGDANLTNAFANTDSRIAIEFSTAQSDTEWMLAVYTGGTGTRTATGVTVAANTYYRLRIEGDSTGSVRAIIDGGTPTSSVTSNLPTASGHIAFCVQTHTSAEKKLYYDRFAAKIKRQ